MCRIDRLLVLTAIMLLTTLVFAQGTTSQATATCNFNVNDQVAVEYQRFSVNSKNLCLVTKSLRQSLGAGRKTHDLVHQYSGSDRRP